MKRNQFSEKVSLILAGHGLIKHDDIVALQKDFDESSYDQFEYFLLDEKIVTKQALLDALSTYYRIPSFDAIGYFFDHALVCQIPEEILIRNCIIPLECDDNGTLVVIAGNPENPSLLEEIGCYVSYDIELYVGIARDIIDSIREFYDTSITAPAWSDDNDIYGDGTFSPEEKNHIHRQKGFNPEDLNQDERDDIRGIR